MGVKKIIFDIRAQLDKAVGDMKKLGSESTKAKKKVNLLNSAFKKAAITFGAFFAISKVVQWGKAIGDVIANFQQSMAELSSITGAVGADLDFMRSKAIELSVQLKKTATEVVKAFQLVGSAKPELLKNAAALAEVTKQAIILSQAAGMDVPEAAKILTGALNVWNKGAKDAAHFTDILSDSQKKGSVLIRQLGEGLVNAGSIAAAVGMSFADFNAVMQGFGKGNVEGARAGTAFDMVIRKLAQSADKELNPQFTKMGDILETLKKRGYDDLRKASGLVEAEAAKYLLTLIAQRKVVQELTGNLGDMGAALEQADINTNTIRGHQDELKASWEAFVLSVDSGSGVIGTAWDRMLINASKLLQVLTPEGKILDPEMQDRYDTYIEKLEKTADETEVLTTTLTTLSAELKKLKEDYVAIDVADELALKRTADLIKAKKAEIKVLTDLLVVKRASVFKPPVEEKEEEIGVEPWMLFGDLPTEGERLLKAFEEISGKKLTLDEEFDRKMVNSRGKSLQELLAMERTEADAEVQIEGYKQDNKINLARGASAIAQGLAGENANVQKIIAIAESIISTYLSAQFAYTSLVGIPVVGPGLAKAARINAIIGGLANTALIVGTAIAGYGEGGFTGKSKIPFVDSKGKRIAGFHHENEFIFTEEKTKRLRPFFEDIHNDRIDIEGLSRLSKGYMIQNMINANLNQETLESITGKIYKKMSEREMTLIEMPYEGGIMKKRGSVTTILR